MSTSRGGFSVAEPQWRSAAKSTFFVPVKVLSRRFRTLLTRSLRDAWQDGTLGLSDRVVADSIAFDLLLARAAATDWVVYCKSPFGGPAQVLAYLANYTHRIAISNSRILSFDGARVSFRYRDYAHGNAEKLLDLHVDEFLRRFLLHVLPPKFLAFATTVFSPTALVLTAFIVRDNSSADALCRRFRSTRPPITFALDAVPECSVTSDPLR